jgi:hypothetical protein
MVRKIIMVTLAVILIMLTWFYLVPYIRLVASPFSWAEADRDKSGFVSPSEAAYFAECGRRAYTEDGKNCIEYYALKDGLTLKKECK